MSDKNTYLYRYRIAFICVCTLIIILPNIVTYTGAEKENEFLKAYEVKKAPEWKGVDNLESYIEEYEAYYNENFGLRELLFRSYSRAKYYWLKESAVPENVVIGDSGWMFLGNNFGNVITEHAGIEDIKKEQIAAMCKNLSHISAYLKAKGIDLYIFIAPNKHTVYPEYLNIKRVGELSYADQIIQRLKTCTDVKIFNLDKALISKKNKGMLYHKTDTHWNDLGAFYGYQEMMTILRDQYPALESLRQEDIQSEKKTSSINDLNKILRVKIPDTQLQIQVKAEQTEALPDLFAIPTDYNFKKDAYEMRYKNTDSNLKLLMFRDSFSKALLPFIKQHFKESTFIWQHKFRKDIVEQTSPDIVIYEIVERDIDVLIELLKD